MPNKIKNNKQTDIKAPIVEALKTAYENPTYQFHIPGHTKGLGTLPDFRKLVGRKALMVDTTDEFDNLGTLTPATGPIKEAEELAAKAFGSKKTFFLLDILQLYFDTKKFVILSHCFSRPHLFLISFSNKTSFNGEMLNNAPLAIIAP